jgi:hypothetical protein
MITIRQNLIDDRVSEPLQPTPALNIILNEFQVLYSQKCLIVSSPIFIKSH